MKPVRVHQPGPPDRPEPPEQLVKLASDVRDPLVTQCGVTTTADGRWALYVTVPEHADVPIGNVERQAEGFPVVYAAEPREPPIAGPAYPPKGRSGRRSK
jgi:hypothetical protein